MTGGGLGQMYDICDICFIFKRGLHSDSIYSYMDLFENILDKAPVIFLAFVI